MSAHDPLIGKQLGDYTILKLLGRGGMSRVYQGFDDNLQRFAAVKVISGDFDMLTESEYTARFQREARAIARLRHPNIVGVYQFGRAEGLYYMAQVFLEGTELRALLKRYADTHRLMPYEDVLRITRDVASALDYAHEQGVIHRDIKPSNIMLERRTGRAILMDFGLALSISEGSLGDTFGTAHYIAPEQAVSSAKAVPQSDLYSWGVVLYEMLTGHVPFDDTSVMSVALKHLNDKPPAPRTFNPTLSPEVESVLLRLLDKNPRRRPASGAEMLRALERALGQTAHPTEGVSLEAARMPPAASPTGRLSRERPSSPNPITDTSPLAPRFAKRRAEKQQQAALDELETEDLALDDASLDSLLDSYPDPRELGLVGPGARPITASRPLVNTQGQPIRLQHRRRARPFVLLLSIVLLAVAITVAWSVLVLGGDGDDESVLVGGPIVTPTVAADSVPLMNATPTPRTQAPGVVPASPTPRALASATPVPATPPATPANVRLVYSATDALMVNISDDVLDLSGLIFEQHRSDGDTLRFEASAWDRSGVIRPPSRMTPGTCFQLVTSRGPQRNPPSDICSQLLGWISTGFVDRYFWLADEPDAAFNVRLRSGGAPLATCPVDTGTCEFYVPQAG